MTAIVHVQLFDVAFVSGDRLGRLTACGATAVTFTPFVQVSRCVWPNDAGEVTCPSCRRKMGGR